MRTFYITVVIGSIMGLNEIQPAFSQTRLANIIDSNATPAIFAPGIISTPYSEWSTSFTPDGRTVYSSQGGSYWTIIYATKKGGKWVKPTVAPFSGKYKDTDPFVSPDGKKIFFISNRPGKGLKDARAQTPSSIWYADQINGNSWAEPKQLDTMINLPNIGNYAPSVSAKGTLFYCSRRKTLTGMQSFFAEWLGDHYEIPRQLIIKGAAQIQDPFIAPDENYIIFLNGNDLFISFKEDQEWGEAQNLGPIINNGDNNSSPYVSRDGKTLYYSSGRTKGFYERDLNKPALNYDQLVKENSGLFNTDGNILMVPIHLEKK